MRRLFEDAYGASRETSALSSLERLADPLVGACPLQAISVWRELDASLENHPRLRRLLQLGVFGRLLLRQSAEELVAASPESLPTLALALASGLTTPLEDGTRQARRLIRDALIAGLCLEPLSFRWDEPVADLLGEGDAPPWLACLGVIRRLWPAGGATAEDFAALSGPVVDPGSSEQAARLFWRCPSASEDQECSREARQEARRRMKTLRHEWHALYMRRVRI